MAKRNIETVLRVQHESEYKAALKNCTSELKVMKSELTKVSSEYRNNANSMEALTAKGQVLSKMYTAQEQKVELLRGAMAKSQSTRDAEAQTVADLRDQYAKAQKTLKEYAEQFGENSEEYTKQKAVVDSLRESVLQHEAKLESATRSTNQYATQLNRATVELNDLSDQQEENARLLGEAEQSADHCAKSIDRYGDAVKQAGEQTDKSTSAVEALAGALIASGLKDQIDDVAASMMECSKAAQAHEVAIQKIGTVADATVLSQKELHDQSLQLAMDLHRDVDEVTDAAYNALSAGVKTGQVMDFTRQSAMLAKAGFTDLGTSVDVLTSIENAYNLAVEETERVSSVLVKTQDLGKVTVDDLGKTMGRVIPSAAAYHVSLENVATSYAVMTANGVNAENTTTNLGAMLDELASSGSQVSKILQDQTGKTFAGLMEEGKSLGDVLDILGASVAYDNTQFANLWASSTAGKAALSLYDGSAQKFNNTLNLIANSSGAVARNYEMMSDTSEHASKRVEVASKNLKIAVGDQLNPVLDKLRNSGADVLEVATQAVTENPALVSTIAGTVTALGTLAVGLTVATKAKAAAAAMSALNATMLANPAVLVAAGLVALGTALATYMAQTETAAEKVDQLTQSAQALSDTVTNSAQAYDDSMASAEAAGATVDRYIDRLEELEKQGLHTDAQQQEYAMTLDKINHIMPDLNAELDAQTGLVKGGTPALRAQADAWKNLARQQAIAARYKSDISALADAEYELAKNQAELNMAQKDGAEITAQLQDVTQQLSAARQAENELAVQGSTYLGFNSAAQEEARATTAALEAQQAALQAQQVENSAAQAVLNEAIAAGQAAMDEATPHVQAAEQAYNELSSATEQTAQTTAESSASMAASIEEAEAKAAEAYEQMYTAAHESLSRQIGLFDDLSGKSDLSMETMIDRLNTQADAFNSYADNITIALERGIDIGLVRKLSDGSVESLQILAELVSGSDTQIDELNQAFERTSEGRDAVARTMTDIKMEMESSLNDIRSFTNREWYGIGASDAEGYCRGFGDNERKIINTTTRALNNNHRNGRRTEMINSPSKRWKRIAEWDVEGLVQGFREGVPKYEAQTKQLMNAGYSSAIKVKQAQLPAMAARSMPAQHQDTELLGLLRQVLSAVQAGHVIQMDGKTLVGATVPGVDAALGRNRIYADRGGL